LLFVITAGSAQSMGWGGLGHRATGHVAQAYLSPQARQAVNALMRGGNLADASTWADGVRSDPAYNHASWYHFEKVQDGVPYLNHLRSLPADMRDKGSVVQGLLVAQRTLEDSRRGFADKEVALKFLVHFIGDLHQPLHSGRPEDKGGNKIPVTWFNTPTNLHSVWDTGMIMVGHADLFQGLPPTADFSVPYTRWILEAFKNNQLPPRTRDNPESWLIGSMQHRPRAYDPAYNTNQTSYMNANLPVVDWRVHTAGLRIADTLNRIFAGAPPSRVQIQFMNGIEAILGRLADIVTLGPRTVQTPPEESYRF
jgi:hypothetical protein